MPKENYKYKISIIIASYQSFASIAPSVSSILLQKFPQEDYEIIVIGHGIEINRDTAPLNYIKNVKVIYVERRKRKPYEACRVRNQGIKIAEGKLVFFMHDNVNLIGNDYLDRLWGASNSGKNGVKTTKKVYVYNKDGTINYEKSTEVYGFFAHQDAVPLYYLQQVNGFDEIYDGDHGYDDIDLLRRCEEAGCEFTGNRFNLYSVKHNLASKYRKGMRVSGKNNSGERNRSILYFRGFSEAQ